MQIIDEEISASEEVSNHVRRLIARGDLKRWAKLPSYRELAVELGVAPLTAKRGVDLLAEQGIVRRRQRQGCFVNRELSVQGRSLKSVGIIHAASQRHLFTAPYLTQIMQGISSSQKLLDVHIFTLREQGPLTAARLADHHIDGVILLGVENDDYLREFATWGAPGVVADYFTDGIPLDFVACDNATAVREAVRRLVDLGHRRIRYVGCDPVLFEQVAGAENLATRSADLVERREMSGRELARHPGVRWDEAILPRSAALSQRVAELAMAWQRDPDRPTAFMVDGDSMANMLLRGFAELGVAVPDGVSVCTVAMATPRVADNPALTGARFDFTGMGRKAVELLRRRCEEPDSAPEPAVYRIGFEWVEGGTCGRMVNG